MSFRCPSGQVQNLHNAVAGLADIAIEVDPLIGHESQRTYLSRLVNSDRIPHSMLFTGPQGIGKYTAARYFAGLLLCTADTEKRPCGVCSGCQGMEKGRLMDFVELDGDMPVKAGSADEPGTVRHLVARLSEKSVSGGYVVLIRGLERINESGQNILLKTIEEPGEGTRIIMTASSRSSVLKTIRSRSSILDFYPLSYEDMCSVLGILPEHHSIEEAALIGSGGSVTLARELLNEEVLMPMLEFAGSMAEALRRGTDLRMDEGLLQKELKEVPVIAVLINLFRYILSVGVRNDIRYNRYMEKLYIDDVPLLHNLIKSLLSLKRDTRFNVNMANGLKSILCTLVL